MQLQIHQFSLGLQINQNTQGQYVSGGFYGETIDHPSFKVPPGIQEAVKGDLFKIPDGYPPEPGQLALIAREVGQYCVLAVANRLDDFMDRNLVGYRYFWLDTELLGEGDDGIATLLLNWCNKGQPCLNLEDLKNKPHLYTKSWDNVEFYLQQKYMDDHKQGVESLYREITNRETPVILSQDQLPNDFTFAHLHCLAIEYQVQTQKPISWAWNVRRLSVFELPDKKQKYPSALVRCQSFQLICCPDQKDTQWFQDKLNRLKSESNKNQGNAQSNVRETNTKNATIFEQKLGNLDVLWPALKELADFYQNDPNQLNKANLYSDYLKQFNNQANNHANYDTIVRYVTIFVALAPDKLKPEKTKLLGLKQKYKQAAIEHLNNVINLVPKVDKNPYNNFISALKQLLEELQKPSDNHWQDLLKKFILPILATVGLSAIVGLYFFLSPSSKEQNGHLGIFSKLPFRGSAPTTTKTGGNEAGKTTNADNPQTELAKRLNRYEQIFSDVEKGKKNQIEQSESFKSRLYDLQKSKGEISQILDGNQQVFAALSSQDSKAIQKAREQDIYQQLKLFTTLNPLDEKIKTLPFLQPGGDNVQKDVIMLQKALARGKSYYVIGQESESGIFDEATKNAVINAQTQAKFLDGERKGNVGLKTWGEILKYRVQDLQVEAVYQKLQTHLKEDNPTVNIVTEIRNCRDEHKDKTPLHFNECLENIGGKADSASTTTKTTE